MEFNSHIGTAWFERAREAKDKGIDNITLFGIKYLMHQYNDFYKNGYHKVKPYHISYQPNPFRYQYDLMIHIWINYYEILKQEIAILRKENKNEQADLLMQSRTLYGIERHDFLFGAGELRWPTTILPDGGTSGQFIRDPWSERRLKAFSSDKYKYVFGFGGGGQGKTHISMATLLMIFDHYIFTNKGARCMFSTVNEDKIESVSWPYLVNLNTNTEKGISLYAGKGKAAGARTIRRPETKDTGGVFRGILIGNQMNPQSIIDKLTGSHGHPFIGYLIDEMQSTPGIPISAASNFTMHAKDYRILGAGNWGEPNDTLAENVKPDSGWDSVNETTGEWISTCKNGSKAIVLHFNNNLSPGMTDEGNKKWPHLPNKRILDERYPPAKRDPEKDIGYRRFWIGFRVKSIANTSVVSESLVKENNANRPLSLSETKHRFYTFDSAPAELDRNILITCEEGTCSSTKDLVFGFKKIHELKKATDSIKYYNESSQQILQLAKKNNINSGGGVHDWTGRPAHPEILASNGFMVHKIIYNKGVPDGKRRDIHTGKIERAIRINADLDFRNDIPQDKLYAHHIAENQISLGAWALREYIRLGRVVGLTDELFEGLSAKRSIDEELYNRKFYLKNSGTYGERFHLQPKDKFKEDFGFSPDILDCMFQAAWYMLMVRKFPLTPVGKDDTVSKEEEQYDVHEEMTSLWDMESEYEESFS